MDMILWEDSEFVVIHKPSGLPTTPSPNSVDCVESLFPGTHAVHRLDQRVSGLVLLAKTTEAMTRATRLFQEGKVKKTYHAVVNQLPQSVSPLRHWIKQEKTKARTISFPKEGFQKAELTFAVLASSTRYHVLEICPTTGRFHQIRAQMSAVGAPIVGDIKYGFKRTTPDGSIFLQASKLQFPHPTTGEVIDISLPLPENWAKYGFTNPHNLGE